MTRHDFEVIVNILLAQGRKLHAIKFMRDCIGDSDVWLGLSDNKKMVDNATRTINSIGIQFRIIHYPEFDKKALNRLRMANVNIISEYITGSIKQPYNIR